MLIIEGPDGSGKTSLIKFISEWYEISVAPRVVSKDAEAMTDLQAWVDENLNQGFQRRIFDRHRLISETIYGPILRREQQPGFDDLNWLASRMNRFYALEPTIIYCLPPLKEVKKNLFGDVDNTAIVDYIDPIYSAYCSRISLDLQLNKGITKVWNYSASLTTQPQWIHDVVSDLFQRTVAI